jgi:hypothetical protein
MLLRLGMTGQKVINSIQRVPDKVVYDVYSEESGPYQDWITWLYYCTSIRDRTCIDVNEPTQIYFDINKQVVGWDISKDFPMIPIIGFPFGTSPVVAIGSTKDQVVAAMGTPMRIYPQDWDNSTNPEVWEFRGDDQRDIRLTVKFQDGIVTEIDTPTDADTGVVIHI